jgi:hypothetical protein
LRKLLKPGEKLNVIFDSTGVKVFGKGEWKVRKHGYSIGDDAYVTTDCREAIHD